ncbi:nucleoside/nucleotide kinase family protein [Frondihabitans cladoniiphilus]|uniref:Uncharacterized protein n=1 Tax=Frondihabitans cladoniiphilus TaxID=715785 RepID=A0ABP8VMR1_9MICO
MTRWAPQKSDTVRSLATEILHNYASGRAFVAVDGLADAGVAAFSDDLAAALRELDHAAERASFDDYPDEAALRTGLVDPFRAGRTEGPAVLVVDGALDGHDDLRGLWNYAVWVEGAIPAGKGYDARFRTDAVIDNADPEHPRRLFDDAC